MKETKNNSYQISTITRIKGYFKTQAIPIGVLVLMIIIASVLSDVFFSRINLQNLLIQQAANMVVSLGMFACILSGGIDLSVGSQLAVASVFMADILNKTNVVVAILVTILICICIGLVNGSIIAKLRIAPFIVTLGMTEFARGIAFWYTGSSPVSWREAPDAAIMNFIGKGKLGIIPVLTIIMVIMLIIAWILMNKTIVGRVIYAIGGNEEAVNLSGINVSNWKIIPYVLSGICCAIGGILMTARLGLGAPTNGEDLANDCIAAVVIGGTSFSGGKGNISGVVIGVFILGIINNILDLLNVSSYPQMMLKGVIIVLAVVFSTIKDKNA